MVGSLHQTVTVKAIPKEKLKVMLKVTHKFVSSGILGPLHGLCLLLLSTGRIDPEFGCKCRIVLFFGECAKITKSFRSADILKKPNHNFQQILDLLKQITTKPSSHLPRKAWAGWGFGFLHMSFSRATSSLQQHRSLQPHIQDSPNTVCTPRSCSPGSTQP